MLANTAQFQPITLAQLNSLGYQLDLSDLKEDDDLQSLIGFDDLWYDDYADNLGIWTAEQQAAIDAQNAAAEAVLAGQEALGKSESERLATLRKRINKLVKISNDIENPDYDTLTDDAFNGKTFWTELGYTFDDNDSSNQLESLGFMDALKKVGKVAKKVLPVAAAGAAIAAPIAAAAGGEKAGNIAGAVAEGLGSVSQLQLEALRTEFTDEELQALGFGSFLKKVGSVAKKVLPVAAAGAAIAAPIAAAAGGDKAGNIAGAVAEGLGSVSQLQLEALRTQFTDEELQALGFGSFLKKVGSVAKKALPIAAAGAAIAAPIAAAAGGEKAGNIAGAVAEGLGSAAGLMELEEPELSTLLEALSEEDLQALMQYSI